MYPTFVEGILNRARQIRFFVLWNEELSYEYYIEKFIGDKGGSVPYNSEIGHLFEIPYHVEAFQARIFPKLPSELMFTQSVLKKNS